MSVQGHLICAPVGCGKTRDTWHLLLRPSGMRGNLCLSRLGKTLIMGPNAEIERIWLRELLLYLVTDKRNKEWRRQPQWKPKVRNLVLEILRKKNDQPMVERFMGRRGRGAPALQTVMEEISNHIRRRSTEKLKHYLYKNLEVSTVRFRTYGQVKRTTKAQRRVRWDRDGHDDRQLWILDEWHRMGRLFEWCTRWVAKEDITGRWPWFLENASTPLNGSLSRRAVTEVFLVSATPVNPVFDRATEDADAREEESQGQITKASMEKTTTEAETRALAAIKALLNIRRNRESPTTFIEECKTLDIHFLNSKRRHPWKPPKVIKTSNMQEESQTSIDEHEMITDWLKRDQGNSFGQGYARVAGLIANRWRKVERIWTTCQRNELSRGRCFAHEYVKRHLYYHNQKACDAVEVLCNHSRVKRLLGSLEAAGIIMKKGDKYGFTERKGLIFCVHAGVARGLYEALSHMIDMNDNVIVCSEKAPKGKARMARRRFTEQIKRFRGGTEPPYLAVLTDRYSESIDLHEHCQHLIHYELPWSPIRLFQRVGRLTRLLNRGSMNKVWTAHVIVPGGVEEERVNRLIRRAEFLHERGLWPPGTELKPLVRGLLGSGPSLHLKEWLARK